MLTATQFDILFLRAANSSHHKLINQHAPIDHNTAVPLNHRRHWITSHRVAGLIDDISRGNGRCPRVQ